jgi:hypothetical protein
MLVIEILSFTLKHNVIGGVVIFRTDAGFITQIVKNPKLDIKHILVIISEFKVVIVELCKIRQHSGHNAVFGN